jgi:anaerobic selenocysteine-containing dehydrogenase
VRPKSFRRVRELPLVGRAADWGLGPRAASRKTREAGARIAGLKATESVCPYCAVGCGQVDSSSESVFREALGALDVRAEIRRRPPRRAVADAGTDHDRP